MILTLVAILVTLSILTATAWSLRSPSAMAASFRHRLPTLYGAIGGLASLLLPWVSFSLLNDIGIIPPLVLQALPTALEILSDVLGLMPMGIAAWLLDRTMSLPGYMLFVAMPGVHPLAIPAVAAPAVAGLLGLITGLIAFLAAGRLLGKIVGGVQLVVSIAGLGLLLAEMPRLDQWGTMGDFKTGLMAVSIGTGLDLGAWVAVIALALMAIGAVLTLTEPEYRTPAVSYPSYSTPAYGPRTTPPWR